MSKFKFVLNRGGVAHLLKSPEMQEVLEQYASGVKNRAGEGYEQDIYIGKTRANAMVWPESGKAKDENLKNNTALKAMR